MSKHHATFILCGCVQEIHPGRQTDTLRMRLDHENGYNYSLFDVTVPSGSALQCDEVLVTGIISTSWDREMRRVRYHYNGEQCEVIAHAPTPQPYVTGKPLYTNNPYNAPQQPQQLTVAPPELNRSPNTYGKKPPSESSLEVPRGMSQQPGDTRYTVPDEAQAKLFQAFLDFMQKNSPP